MLGHAGFRLEDIDDFMIVVARKAADVTAERPIRERLAAFEHPSLAAELSERDRRLEAATAELEAMRRRKAIRIANALRRPFRRLRARR
jgi:hypothetical protein